MKYFIKIFEKDIKDEISKGNLKNVLDYNLNYNPYEVHKIYSKRDLEENLQTKILYPRLDIGAGIKGYGKNTGGKGIHVDNPQRLISILFYSGGYSKMVGGELRIWEKHSEELKKLFAEKVAVQPRPTYAEFLLSTSSDLAWLKSLAANS